MYTSKNKYIWDYWIIKDDKTYHLFHLQASRNLGDPDTRHKGTSVGHAISKDLENWTALPDALKPDPINPYENISIHTGSVIKEKESFYMLYTGTGEKGKNICLAKSNDLLKWDRHPGNPVLSNDCKYYEKDGTWADPFLVKNPNGEGYFTFFKAKDKFKEKGYNGCIGAAFSRDLINWEILPPVYSPGFLREPEVPAVYQFGKYFCLITMVIPPTATDRYCQAIYPSTPQWGDIYMISDNILGPYHPIEGIQLTQSEDKMLMLRIIEAPSGEPVALSWRQGYENLWKDWIKDNNPDPVETCVLNDPVPVKITFGRDKLKVRLGVGWTGSRGVCPELT